MRGGSHTKPSANSQIMAKNLRVGVLNVNHLVNKCDNLVQTMIAHSVDVMCVTETFLDETITSSRIAMPGFKTFRLDRPSHGGGVVIYASNSVRVKRRADLECLGTELLFAEVCSRSSSCLVGCLYRPPSSPTGYWDQLQNLMERVKQRRADAQKPIVLVGDFNVDINHTASPQHHHYESFCSLFGFTNFVNGVTHVSPQGHMSTLDLVLSDTDNVQHCQVSPCAFSDHHFVRFSLRVEFERLQPKLKVGRNISRISRLAFQSELESAGIMPDIHQDVESAWNAWYDKITIILDNLAPQRKYHVRQRHGLHHHPWSNDTLQDAVSQKQRAHRKWLACPRDAQLRDSFVAARRHVKQLNRTLKAKYFQQLCQGGPKQSWNVINNLAGRKAQQEQPDISTQILADHYKKIVTDDSRPNELICPQGAPEQSALVDFAPCTIPEVATLLSHVDSRKSSGADDVPGVFLKKFAVELAPSICTLFNMSLSCGTVPSVFKQARITPVFKGGDETQPQQYRPISLLPILSKILERLVQRRVMAYLVNKNLLPSAQFAYRPQHSTEDSLVLLTDKLLHARDRHSHTGVVSVDLSKAFDRVNHQRLIVELFLVGIQSTALRWFSSYLTDRIQYVSIPGKTSSSVHTCQRGVPQGSVLGPLLYLLYVRNLESVVRPFSVDLQLYADDILLTCSHSSEEVVNQRLTSASSALSDYLLSMQLIVNTSKTTVLGIGKHHHSNLTLRINIAGTVIKQVPKFKYLGAIIDDKLSWKDQISATKQKVSRKLRTFWQIRHNLTDSTATLYHNSLIMPDLLYASNALWPGFSLGQIDQLKKLWKSSVRCTAKADPLAHTLPLAAQLNLPLLDAAASKKLLILAHRCCYGAISPLLSTRLHLVSSTGTSVRTRGCDSMQTRIPSVHSEAGRRRPIFASSVKWNELTHETRTIRSLAHFKLVLPNV